MASRPSLVPRPSMPPVFDCLQYAKMEGEGLGNFITWSTAQQSHQMSSCLLLTAKWYTRPILHSVLATVTGLKIPCGDAIISWSEKTALFGVAPGLYHSHSSAVMLQSSTWICFTGRTYLSSGTCFDSLASL